MTLRLRQTEQDLDQRIAQAQATRTALQVQKNRALTDAFVEDWVRRKMHYIRDGETLVIPQITPAPTPPSAAVPAQGDGNPSVATSCPANYECRSVSGQDVCMPGVIDANGGGVLTVRGNYYRDCNTRVIQPEYRSTCPRTTRP